MPKEMLPIVDKPLIQYALEEAMEAGIEEFVLVTGRGKNLMEDHFDHAYELEAILSERGKFAELEVIERMTPDPGRMSYTRQRRPRGLGHAVWCARQFIAGEPFAVVLPDDLILAAPGCLKQMVDVYQEAGGNLVAVEDVPREQTDQYGILDVETDDGRLAKARGLVEKPAPEEAPSTLSIIGRYILQPEVFDHLDKHEEGAGGEIQLTDALAKTIGDTAFHGLRFDGRRFDCGTKIGFVAANVAFAVARDELNGDVREIIQSIL
jgi:UTP--glucose-1-phosphate uridylyltransferase